jgi:hypothetical protein
MEGRYNGVADFSRRIKLRFCGAAEIQGTVRLNTGLLPEPEGR